MLGVAIGDAMGAPYEGLPPSLIPQDISPPSGFLRYTDDTHMTIGVAESLIECRGFDGAHMSQVLKANYEQEPWRGYGAGPPEVFRKLDEGLPWDKAAYSLFDGAGSFGNGAAMRVAPVAAFAFANLRLVETIAAQTAIITHTHELGRDGAVLQALAIAFLIKRSPAEGLDAQSFVQELAARISNGVYREKLQTVAALLALHEPAQVIERLGNSTAALESVPTALYCFLRQPTSFVSTIRDAISLGGDTDTIASMAGALAGAFLGEEAIPHEWAGRIEGYSRVLSLADDLVSLHYFPSRS